MKNADRILKFSATSLRLLIIVVTALIYAVIMCARSGAHDPITTNVRFTKEVVRILRQNCLDCHRPEGFAPMSLATYEEARPWAKAIKEMLLEGHMPPWNAVKGYGEFSNAPRLTPHEVETIVNWVEGGAPKGDLKDLPAGPLYSDEWALGPPDLTLQPQRSYKLEPEADERREVLLPTGLKKDQWMTAIDLQPGARSVVHCADFYLEQMTGRGREGEKQQVVGKTLIGAWMPGQRAVVLPEGTAQQLPAGSRLRMVVHYRGSREAREDRSAVGIYFAKAAPQKQLRQYEIMNPDVAIPVGADPQEIKASFDVPRDSEMVALRPLAHHRIVSLEATAYRPDGTTEVLIWTRRSRFDWQPVYYFKQPIRLPKKTRVEVTAYVLNSADDSPKPHNPPPSVRLADLTSDPLCLLFLAEQGTPPKHHASGHQH